MESLTILLALLKSNLTNPHLTCGGWCELKCKYLSVCVGFLYTVISKEPSDFNFVNVSKKGSNPSFSTSTANCMEGLTLFRWSRSLSTSPFLMMQRVTSTYRFQILGLAMAVSRVIRPCRGWPRLPRLVTPWQRPPSARSRTHCT